MSLRLRVFLFVAVVLAVMAATIYVPSQHFVTRSFSQMETADAVKDMERLRDAVLNDIATLGEVASDYAAWDATVGFMTGEYPNYIQENLSGETFGNLRIHLALFLKLDGTVVWSRFMNAESDREMPLPEELKRELRADSKLLAHEKNDTLVSGLLGLSDSSIMLASYPVVHNDRSGQMYGVVILGRLFSRAEASRLAELTHIPFNIGTSWPTAPEDAVISQSATIIVRPVDRKSLDAQCLMRDVNGQPALSLQTTLPRAIHAKGQILVTYMMVVLACIVVVFGVLIAVLMERHLIKPITSLSADAVLSLGAGGTHGEANERAGNELATLAAIVDNAKVFRKLLMNSSDIICVLDRNGRIKYVSRSVERVLGWPRETLLSRSFFDILHPDDVERAAKDFQQLLRGDLLGELQFSVRRFDAEYAFLAVSSTNMLNDPDVEGLMLNARDITEKVYAERVTFEAKETAERANRMKSEFLANVSHEIRTPLNGVIGFAEIILGSQNAENMRQHAKIILRESESLMQLINTLLDHAKIEAGKLEIDPQPFSLDVVLDSVCAYAKTQAARKGLLFDLSMSSRTPSKLVGDALRLRQVLMNLLSNAVKFTSKGRITLSVDAEPMDDNQILLRFEVSDTGIGIPEDKQSLIFESFSQAETGTARRYGGTGLGTTIARRLVELMSGMMGLSSEEGRGTTFWFTIPYMLHDGPIEDCDWLVSSSAGEDLPGAIGKGLRILVADDYEPNCDLVRMHLEEAGYAVVTCGNGAEAVSACQTQYFDLVLMDVQMPVMDGFEATRHIRANDATADLPIIALTAHVGEETRNECVALGMSATLPKPIRKTALMSVVTQWIGKSRLEEIEAAHESADVRAEAAAGSETSAPLPTGAYFKAITAATLPLDYGEALREFNGKQELVDRVATRFVADVKEYVVIIRQAIEAGDTNTLLQYGHKLHGSAATLAAHPLACAGAELENAARDGMSEEMNALVCRVEEEYARLAAYWTELLNERNLEA